MREWQQTRQREYVMNSKHYDAVRLMRIWKYRNNVEFSTFPLDLITIEALKEESSDKLDEQITIVLKSIKGGIDNIILADPGNRDNDIGRFLSYYDKEALRMEAAISLRKTRWMEIIW